MAKNTYSAPSVKKAFKILDAISNTSNGLGISELSKKLRIGKSTIHGITATLEEMGILIRDPVHKRYTVGYSLLEFCRTAYGKMSLKELARKPMERLMEKVGETISLAVLNGDHITIVDMVESRNEMKITTPPGTRLSRLAGAIGRGILSLLEKEDVKKLLAEKELIRYTPKTMTDPKLFLKEIEKVKEQGYALDDEEYMPGVRAVAVPLSLHASPPAVICALGFTSTLDDQKIKTVIREIQLAAREINESLNGNFKQGAFD